MAIDTLRQAEPSPAPLQRAPKSSPRLGAGLRRTARGLALGAYVVAVVVVAIRHEPWFDEAQAWLLARDEPLVSLLISQMRYEGSPAGWHLLLMGPAKLGLPYAALGVISVAIAVAGGFVLVRYAPFPLPLVVGMLFSFVVAYQYAVVARSYVLLPLLLFLLAIAWRRRLASPWPFVLVLCLLANVSVHGLLIAGSVFAVHLFELLRPPDLTRQVRSGALSAGAVFVGVCGLVVAQLWPPPDQHLSTVFNPDLLNFLNVTPGLVNSALTGNPLASLVAVALSAWWFRRTRTLLLWALPTLALAALSAMKYHNYWHDGIPFLVWVFALWVSVERGPVVPASSNRWARFGAYTAMAGVLVVQGVWWWQTATFDWTNPYSGSKALAAWLQEQDLEDAKVETIGFHALGALPYLDENVYDNNNGGRRQSYMHWSTHPRLHDDVWSVWLDQPDVVIWVMKTNTSAQPALPGYERVAVFEGQMYWKNRVIERDAFSVFRPAR